MSDSQAHEERQSETYHFGFGGASAPQRPIPVWCPGEQGVKPVISDDVVGQNPVAIWHWNVVDLPVA